MKHSLLATAALTATLVAASPASAAILTATYTDIPPTSGFSGFVNLPDEGDADWALFLTTANPGNAKPNTDLISNAFAVGGGSITNVGPTDLSFSTTAGATSGTAPSRALTSTGFDTNGRGVGLTITVPTLDLYTARIYVGGFGTGANVLTVSLPGEDSIVFNPTYGTTDGGKHAGVVEVSFQADSLTGGNNTLNFSLTLTESGATASSHVLLQAATVSVPEPASLALVGLGGLMMLPRRRRA